MLCPRLGPGIEKRHEFPGIETGQIRPLMKIAPMTGETEIRLVIGSTVLSGNDMFDVKSRKWKLLLWKVAVFALIARSFSNALADGYGNGHILYPADEVANTWRAFACRTAMKFMPRTYESYSARSASVKVPAVFFSASSSSRCWTSEFARSFTSRPATSGVRQSPTGSNSCSRTSVGDIRLNYTTC